jgi:hypothetical protein
MSKLAKALTAAAGNAGGGATCTLRMSSRLICIHLQVVSDTIHITNGIDLGWRRWVWFGLKKETVPAIPIWLMDTERGARRRWQAKLSSNGTLTQKDRKLPHVMGQHPLTQMGLLLLQR